MNRRRLFEKDQNGSCQGLSGYTVICPSKWKARLIVDLSRKPVSKEGIVFKRASQFEKQTLTKSHPVGT